MNEIPYDFLGPTLMTFVTRVFFFCETIYSESRINK